MATKMKSKKKLTKKRAARGKTAKKKAPPKKLLRAKASSRKTAGKTSRRKEAVAVANRKRGKSESANTVTFEPAGLGSGSAGQSGDLQGLSNAGRANSESVDELLEEGNSFEAEAVKGVEDAGDADEGEVHTHEVPEDDVPQEYLDKD